MAQLNDLIVNGNTRFLNSAYGNLVGSAASALTAGTASYATAAGAAPWAGITNKPGLFTSSTTGLVPSSNSTAKFLRGDATWQTVITSTANCVPTSRTVNGKALSANVTIGIGDISNLGTYTGYANDYNSNKNNLISGTTALTRAGELTIGTSASTANVLTINYSSSNGIIDLTGQNPKILFTNKNGTTQTSGIFGWTYYNSPTANDAKIPGAGNANGWFFVNGTDNGGPIGFYSQVLSTNSAYVKSGDLNGTLNGLYITTASSYGPQNNALYIIY